MIELDVAGLKLAMPKVYVGDIIEFKDFVDESERTWLLGMQSDSDGIVHVIDSCAWIMGDRYKEFLYDKKQYKYIIKLHDTDWGIACESFVETTKMPKEGIIWRQVPGKRPWLAGLNREKMCVLFEVDVLIELLDAKL